MRKIKPPKDDGGYTQTELNAICKQCGISEINNRRKIVKICSNEHEVIA